MRNIMMKSALAAAAAMLLVACQNNGNPAEITNAQAGKAAVKTAAKPASSVAKLANLDLAALEKQAASLTAFEYQTNENHYFAYSSAQIEMVKSKNAKFFYQNGKLIAAEAQEGAYQFDAAGKVIASSNGASADKGLVLFTEGNKLAKLLSYTAADKRQVNTGDEAKLNYLCITKIRQVAQTDRVFRSSANSANSLTRLTADMRLNGNQFYKMDCQLNGDRVAKLSLLKK